MVDGVGDAATDDARSESSLDWPDELNRSFGSPSAAAPEIKEGPLAQVKTEDGNGDTVKSDPVGQQASLGRLPTSSAPALVLPPPPTSEAVVQRPSSYPSGAVAPSVPAPAVVTDTIPADLPTTSAAAAAEKASGSASPLSEFDEDAPYDEEVLDDEDEDRDQEAADTEAATFSPACREAVRQRALAEEATDNAQSAAEEAEDAASVPDALAAAKKAASFAFAADGAAMKAKFAADRAAKEQERAAAAVVAQAAQSKEHAAKEAADALATADYAWVFADLAEQAADKAAAKEQAGASAD